jgi:hypothetical protein
MTLNDLKLESLKRFTESSYVAITSYEGDQIEIPFKIDPRSFLRFAESDYRKEYPHHIVNALSNTKRAIECQMDSLLYAFGLFSKAQKERWSFRKKADSLGYLGILAPGILKNINRKRNLLEHEYYLPEKPEVEDALDVAKMFLEYTDKFLSHEWLECPIQHTRLRDFVKVSLDYKKRRMTLQLFKANKKRPRRRYIASSLMVDANSPEYLGYAKWFIQLTTMF